MVYIIYTDFNDAVNKAFKNCLGILTKKGNIYAEDCNDNNQQDRLACFKKAATLQNITQKQALFGMLSKHLVSIADMVKSDLTYTEDQWSEKICDSINYFLILYAMIEEENTNE